MNESFFASLGFKLILLLTAGVAVTTAGVAATRVSSAIGGSKVPKQGLEISNVTPTVKPEVAGTELKLIEEVREKKTEGKCIITLFSKQYDVTEPNKAGGSGDLFDCGDDMTSKYSAKYGNNVAMMEKYLVGAPTISPTVSPNSPSVSPLPTKISSNDDAKGIKFEDDEDEREDEEHEDRYEKEEEDNEVEHEEKSEVKKIEIEDKED